MDDYRIILIPEEENEWRNSGVNIKVMRKVNNSNDPELARYVIALEQFVTPFSIQDNEYTESQLKVTEVIGPLKLNKIEYDISENENIDQLLPSKIISKSEVDTTISRGFCLNIPQIGSLLISHNADVILKIRDSDENNPTPKSLYIETQGQVILNPTKAKLLDLDIKSSATVISGNDNAILHSITFHPIQYGNLTSGLFVDHNSLLSLTNLKMHKSLLMVLGELIILEDCSIEGGYIFNMGKLKMYGNNNKIKNGSYFFNGSQGKFKPYKITIETSAFSNLGKFKFNTATVKTEKAFDNQGEIIPVVELNIKGESEVLNRGDIKNDKISLDKTKSFNKMSGQTDFINKGCLRVYNPAFFHHSGEIDLNEIELNCKTTRIQSIIKAKKASFSSSTLIKHFRDKGPDVEITEASINGVFLNEGFLLFNQKLRTFGGHTEIHNNAQISTQQILCESEESVILGGVVDATNILVKSGKMQIQSKLDKLDSVEVEKTGKLFFTEKAETPNLKWIKSKGLFKIENNVSNLVSIECEKTSHLQINRKISLDKIKSFNKMSGQTDFINVEFKNVKVIDLPPDAKMNFFERSKIVNVETLIVRENASLNFNKNTIKFDPGPKIMMKIYNYGLLVFQTQIFNISSIYNGPKAELVILEEMKVDGRSLVPDDSKYMNVSNYVNLIQDAMKKSNVTGQNNSLIGVFNEGRLLVQSNTKEKINSSKLLGDIGSFFLCTPNDENNPETKDLKRKGLRIYSSYVSSKTAHLKLDNYAIISAKDFVNYGTIYSPYKLRIDETFKISRLGVIGSENGIDFNISHIPICLDESFFPVINGENKIMNIVSMDAIEINDKIDIDLHLSIEASKVHFKGDLTSKSLKIKASEVYIEKGERRKYEIAAQENFEIYTNWFLNHSGILKAQNESKKSKIICSELFQNTGAGEFSEDHLKITYFTSTNRRSDTPQLDKAGLIAAGGQLEIKGQTIDNCFGIINGISGLHIEARTLINNECGLMISTGKTKIKGTDIDNGRVQLDPEFNTCNALRLKSGSIPSYFIKRNRNGYYDNKKFSIERYQGNNKNGQGTPITIYPGYIFSKDDLSIEMKKPCYIGTLVSESDIFFKGEKILTNSVNEMGTLIARGEIKAEFNNAKLEQFNIQARNIMLKTVEKLKLEGIIHTFKVDGNSVDIIDLVKFGNYLGYLSKQETFRRQGDTRMSIGKYISTVYGPSQDLTYDVIPTKDVGLFGRKPNSELFVSTIQNSILNQLVRLTLAPFKGRDILLRVDLINELREKGSHLLDSATNSRSIILQNGDPALIFQQIRDQEVEMEIGGEKVKVPLCNPYLVMSSVTRMISMMKAEKQISLHSMNDIEILTGKTGLESQDLNIEAEGQVIITSQYKYSGSKKVGVDITDLNVPNNLTISGDKGVKTKGVNMNARNIKIKSEHGDIIDFDMPLDMIFNYDMPYHDWWTITGHRDTHSSTFMATGEIDMKANNIEHHGTNMIAGLGGVTLEADNYKYEPSYTEDYLHQQRHRQETKVETRSPKQGGIISAGNVVFKTKNATLIGATIIAPKLSNPTDGNFRLLPAYIDQHIWSRETKKNFWGSSSVEFDQRRHIPVGCRILTQKFEMLGAGTLEMEGVTAKIVNATILKNIQERAAYETSHTVITQSSSGFCPPKINGDCFINSISNVASTLTCFEDAAASLFGIIGNLCQTVNDLTILTNLSTINNPMLSIAQIFLSRFVSSFTFCNVKTVTTIDAKIPYQSQLDIDVLRVSNDRTHLEGNWMIKDKAVIETKEFTTKAPEQTIHQHTETSGYCISLSPAAVFGACLCPNPLTLGACLPNISVFTSDTDIRQKNNQAQVLTADDLFIRCDNAVFSGSTIEARLVECIVSGDLTIEDLTDEFVSVSHSSNFSVNLGGIFALVQSMTESSQNMEQWKQQLKEKVYGAGLAEKGVLADTTFLDPRWKAIPQIRVADETTIKRSVQNLASFVGREKFILKVTGLLHKKHALVGLTPPDGIVANSENEKIEAGRILDEKIQETYQHKKSVFNPCVAEFVQMMASYQSMQQTMEDIEIAKYNEELEKGLCVKDAKMEAKRRTKQLMVMIDNLDKDSIKAFVALIESFIEFKNSYESSKQNESDKNSEKIDKPEKSDETTKTKIDDKKKSTSSGPQKPTTKKEDQKKSTSSEPQKSTTKNDDQKKQQENNSENNGLTVEQYFEIFRNQNIGKSVNREDEDEKKGINDLIQLVRDEYNNENYKSDSKENESQPHRDYKGFDLFIYYATKSIIGFKKFIDEHQTEIGYAKTTIKIVMIVLQIINPGYGLICVIRDLGLEFLSNFDFASFFSSDKSDAEKEAGKDESKKDLNINAKDLKDIKAGNAMKATKQVLDQISFAFSETFKEAVKKFADDKIDDEYLKNQFIEAVFCLPAIIREVKDFYDLTKGAAFHAKAIKKSGISAKQAVKRVTNPLDNIADSMMDNKFYHNKVFNQKNMKPENEHVFEMKNPPKPPPMTPPTQPKTAAPPSATPNVNIKASFGQTSTPTSQTVNFGNMFGTTGTTGTQTGSSISNFWNNYYNFNNNNKM